MFITHQELDYLIFGTADVVSKEELQERMKGTLTQKKHLRVKIGFDPTSPDIHFGHLVTLKKLKLLQDYGAKVLIVIGDFTARIGDPTGRKKTRPKLTKEEISAHAATYQEQVCKILDPLKTEITFNSNWFDKMHIDEMLNLASFVSVAKLLSRADFNERYSKEMPLSLHELYYPLLQAYDSVILKSDVELGGQDQLFNLLLGRDMQRSLGQKPQVVITMPLLEGLDGAMKMSKSYGNTISLNDQPADMFGKIMSLKDDLLPRYISLLSPRPLEDIKNIIASLKFGHVNPMQVKKEFAHDMVRFLHGDSEAKQAKKFFEQRFQQRVVPENIQVQVCEIDSPDIWIGDLFKKISFVRSSSEFIRKVQEGAIKVDGMRLKDHTLRIFPVVGKIYLEMGRKKIAKIQIKQRKKC